MCWPPHALECVAQAVQDSPADLLYSDEDYLDSQGRRVQPIFKPAFSPDLLRCGMYLGHLLVVRTAMLRELGWFRAAYDGSQDYDLALRLADRTAAIRHIPRVLYHWRQHPDSTALDTAAKPYTQAAGLEAVSEAVARRDPQAVVTAGAFPNTYRVQLVHPGPSARQPDHLFAECETAEALPGARSRSRPRTPPGKCVDRAAPRRRHRCHGPAAGYLRLRARAVHRAVQFRGHE